MKDRTRFPCHAKPKEDWCDWNPRIGEVSLGGFMGHTCFLRPDLAYLPLVVEEAGEVIQAAMKLERFGPNHRYRKGSHAGRTNTEALTHEIGDLLEVISRMGLDVEIIGWARKNKSERLKMYSPHVWRPGIEDE